MLGFLPMEGFAGFDKNMSPVEYSGKYPTRPVMIGRIRKRA